MPPEEESLKIIDTENSLTKEELQELKQLAQWSKNARWVVATILACISIFGIANISEFLSKIHINIGT